MEAGGEQVTRLGGLIQAMADWRFMGVRSPWLQFVGSLVLVLVGNAAVVEGAFLAVLRQDTQPQSLAGQTIGV